MMIQAQPTPERELFLAARQHLDQIVDHLAGTESVTLATTEENIRVQVTELARLLLQARLDVLFERERAQLAGGKGGRKRARAQEVESQFGRVVERRHAVKRPGTRRWRYALDEKLNVSADLYSHPLRRRVSEEVADGSFDRALDRIARTTGGHVPKRQAEQLVVRASQDVERYYAERPCPANDTLSDRAVLALSSDGCAIRMVHEGLREPTRQAAEKVQEDVDTAVPGDPTAACAIKPHKTRRVVVTAVWEQERHTRSASDIVANLRRRADGLDNQEKARAPHPQRKRLTASVEQDMSQRIAELFDEADRSDPARGRDTVVLVDGDPHQTETILQEARRRQRSLTLVLDLLHAMHYLWVASAAITAQHERSTKAAVQNLVTRWTAMLLTGDPSRVIATIRGMATRQGPTGKARETVDDATAYLHKRLAFIHYARFIAMGLPIASGVIEGACRHVVRDRLDITGARWNVQVAEAVLQLRAIRSSGDWDDYWRFHLQREAGRNYPAAA